MTSENEIELTHGAKVTVGVKCVVVHDTVTLDGKLEDSPSRSRQRRWAIALAC